MEGDYGFDQSKGPVPDTNYAVHSNQIVDYLAGKNINVVRFLFSWERMQSTLGGPIPAASSGNYKAYFDDYKRIVDYATNQKGMSVIVEPWQASASGGVGGPSWRGKVVGGGEVTSAHFADFWSKMAAVYAANPRVAIGLVNEPSNMSTMTWFATAQDAISGIRNAGFKGDIHVPGNGWTGAGNWSDAWYDTASPQRSNAYGWLNARGVGMPLLDPLAKLVVSVHTYADADAGGSSTTVVSSTITRTRVAAAVDWARAQGLKLFLGEIGMYAGDSNASANWTDFVRYVDANADTLLGYAWWGCGKPGWWNDVGASGGGHFSITPTNDYTVDTVNMTMIQGAFRSL
jgi:endoglucanase